MPRGALRLAAAAELGAVLGLLVIALVAGIHYAYAHPAADDFTVAVQGAEKGAAGYANFIWETKSGRWTGHALLALVLANVDVPRVYPWLIALVALVSLAASTALVRVLLAETGTLRTALGSALLLQAFLWAGSPAVGQTHYWFSGAVPYQLGFACALLVVTGLITCARRTRAGLFGWLVWPLVGLAVSGLQELTGMMLAVALATGAWLAFRLRQATRWIWVVAFALVTAGTIACVLAPGNATRAAEHPEGGDVWLTLRYLGLDGLRATRDWVLEPRALGLALALWLSPRFRAARPRWTRAEVDWLMPFALATLLALAIGLAGPRWATGSWQPPRMLAVVYTSFVHAAFVLLFLLTRGERALPRQAWLRAGALVAGTLVLAFGLGLSGNGRRGLGDLVHGRTQRWARLREQRYAEIEAARVRGEHALAVARPPMAPRVFVPMDVREDPNYWENVFAARYFGLDSLRLRPAAAPPAGR
jgi:hypothetical protein